MNIACSFPNCTNPVIGQCTGYKGECRKYYCSTHSTDNLCHQCASKKLAEENEILAQQEFLKMIGGMRSKARSIAWKNFWERNEAKLGIWIILLLCFVGFIVIEYYNSDIGASIAGTGGFGLLFGIILLLTEISKQENILATDIDKQKQGFLKFFSDWKIEQQKKTLKAIGAVFLFVFVIILAVAGSGSKNKDDDD